MAGSEGRKKNWAELPKELLGLILQNLIVQDHVRFSYVCVSWNLAVKEKIGCPKPQSPWLMHAGNDDTSAQFFCFSEKRTYSIPLPLPEIRKRLCIGSCHGWLITVYDMLEVHLLNPVTRVQIKLPSMKTLPYYKKFKNYPHYLLYKAILSSAPSSDGSGDFTIILLHKPFCLLNKYTTAVARVGDSSWTPLRGPRVVDVIQHKGQLYGIDASWMLHIWDQHGLSLRSKAKIQTEYLLDTDMFLVESVTGDLFLLNRNILPNRLVKVSIKARRLEWEREEFVPVSDLKDNVIFVGKSYSIAVSATEFPELRGNHIYFTDDHYFDKEYREHKHLLMGVFDMEDKSFKPFDNIGSQLNWPPSIWVTPNML